MLSDQQTGAVMRAISDRIGEHASIPGLRYSQAIVNAGREAGASLEHPHGQLLGMSFVPRELVEEQAGFARFAGRCLLCTTVDAEENVGYRVVYSDEQVLVSARSGAAPLRDAGHPPATAPPAHSPTTDLLAVGRALKIALGRLRSVLGDVAYNLVFHSAPYRAPEPYHWHVHVGAEAHHRRRLRARHRVLINIVNPEAGAEELSTPEPVAKTG